MPVIPALGRLRREGRCEFTASLNYTMRSCLKTEEETAAPVTHHHSRQLDSDAWGSWGTQRGAKPSQ